MFKKLNLILTLLVISHMELMLNALSVNPCTDLVCPEKQAGCLEIKPGTSKYECRCSSDCKSLSIINGPVVNTLSPSSKAAKLAKASNVTTVTTPAQNVTTRLETPKIPIARQGGSSCYPSACMNGGTCFSSYTPYATTTTTTTSSYKPPICSCQAQFSGSRCELYNPTTAASTLNNDGWNNLCRVYNDRNMNICQNGGQCVFISDGKVACVCPSAFTGQYCELPVYIQCTSAQNTGGCLCHRDYGTCQADGSCLCSAGYCGSTCDQRVQYQQTQQPIINQQQPTQQPIVNQYQQQPTQQPIVNQYQQQPTQQPIVNQYQQQPTQQPIVNQYQQQPTQQPIVNQYQQQPTQQPIVNQYQQQPTVNPYQQQPTVKQYQQQPVAIVNQYQPTQQPIINQYQQQPTVNPYQQQPTVNQYQQPMVNQYQQQPTVNPYQQQPTVNQYQQQPVAIVNQYQQQPTVNPYQQPVTVNPYQQQPTVNQYQQPIVNPYQQAVTVNPYSQPVTVNPYQQQTIVNPYQQPIVNSYQTYANPYGVTSSTCLSYYCLNGGTCVSTTVDPYVTCVCPPAYTGTRCNLYIGPTNSTTSSSFITFIGTSTTTTSVPRCNFTITVQNDGGYAARFKVQYTVDGIQQPIYVSDSITGVGSTRSVTIPYYAKNILVSLEKLGFNWAGIAQDTNIDTTTRCTKCYKVWGVVTDAQWDYLTC